MADKHKFALVPGDYGDAGSAPALPLVGFIGQQDGAGNGFAANYHALAGIGQAAKTEAIVASGFLTFMLYFDVATTTLLNLNLIHLVPETEAELPAVLISSFPAGTNQTFSFGFRGAALDDQVIALFKLQIVNQDAGLAADLNNLKLWGSST